MARYTLDDLEALESALASGAKRVEYNDRTVEFRSVRELKEAIQLVKKDLGLVKRGGRVLCESKKGTC